MNKIIDNKPNAPQEPSGSKQVGLKVCGMKSNPEDVAALQPDYLGFIFWKPSSRFFAGDMPPLPNGIKKIGVFVDAEIPEVIATVKKYSLDGVQLHGNESPEYCQQLRPVGFSELDRSVDIIKVFSIKDSFDFSVLAEFEAVCNYFLFDTKGKLPGGNGFAFDWSVLKAYPSTKPYFLSGGIGLENKNDITEFLKGPESKYCYAIDVNSKFEQEPGLKKIAELSAFMEVLDKE